MLVQLPERPLNHCDLTVFGSREECGWLGNGAAPSSLSVPSVSSAAVPQWLSLGVCALHLLVILLLFKLSKHFFQSSWKFSWPFKDDSKSSVFAFWSALVKWLRLHMKLGLGLSSGWELLTSWLVCVSWIIWHFPAFLLSARLALQEWTGSSGLWRSTRWGCQGRAGCGTSAVLLGGMPWWERFFQLYSCGVHWKCPGFP